MSFNPTVTGVMIHHPNLLLATAIRSGLELAGQPTAQACSGDLLGDLIAFQPNILIVDPVHLPLELGAWRAEVARCLPKCEVLAYIDADDQNTAMRCIAAGFAGVVAQQQGIEALVEAVTVARLGGIYVGRNFVPALSPPVEPKPAGQAQPNAGLSKRERYVLENVARGFSNKEIARKVGLSPKTIETHRSRATKKLGLRQTSDIVQYALCNQWLAEESVAA